MDWRRKNFEAEARSAFGFLVDQGFQVGTEPLPDLQRRPVSITVNFHGADARVDTSLVLGFAGEDAVHTTLTTVVDSRVFGPTTAHRGHEVKKALHAHAQSVRAALSTG